MKHCKLFILLTIILTGCTTFQEEGINMKAEGTTYSEFRATLEVDEETKTSLKGTSVIWSEGDSLAIFCGTTNGVKYIVKEGYAGGTNTILEKKEKQLQPSDGEFTASTEIEDIRDNVAVYPYSAVRSCEAQEDGYAVTVDLPSRQTYAERSFGQESLPMVAVTDGKEDTDLSFKNVHGFLMLKFTGKVTVRKIEITGNNWESIAGPATISCSSSAAPTVSFGDDALKTVTLDCGEGVTLNGSEAKEFCIALPPIVFKYGITVRIMTDAGQITKETHTSLEINRSRIRPLAPIDLLLVASRFTELQRSVYYNYQGASWDFQIMQNLTSDQWVGYMGTTTPYYNSTTNLMYSDGWTSCQWTETYNHVMWPFTNIIKPSTDNDKYYYLYAPMLVIKVIAMSRVCDYYGPVIYTQYGNDNIDPEFDSVQEAYNAFFADLDDAMERLDTYITQFPGNKPFLNYDEWCGGDYVNWCKLINSVRLRLAMHIVKADPALAKTQAEKAAANKYGFLETYDVMEQGASWSHPLQMITDWGDTSMGATIESFITGYNDPRGFKWFTMTKNMEALKAGHYFMSIRSGIDPKTHDATKYAGISWYGMGKNAPGYIFSAAEAYFLRAEGALRGWSGMGGTVQELYEKGVQASFKQWGCSSVDANYYLNSTAVPADYVDWINPSISAKAVNTLCPKWDESASNEVKLERIIDQKYIAMWPESMEAWATLRRTGYPKQLPVVYNGNPTVFKDDDIVRRCMFPASLQMSNPQGYAGAVQSLGGPDAGNTRLWWDVESEGNF